MALAEVDFELRAGEVHAERKLQARDADIERAAEIFAGVRQCVPVAPIGSGRISVSGLVVSIL